ncbi:hypothetical protein AVEN_82890-1 [Araneus ventricosus]|uniref:Uncharacterized protein n=1 Tax=Araneus ventricosus TaxID=182803 RepID=A0A4Y2K0D7_ARAVE|nr:hypothetical protein AVEN_82890-1 [Araneus ventricosus]
MKISMSYFMTIAVLSISVLRLRESKKLRAFALKVSSRRPYNSIRQPSRKSGKTSSQLPRPASIRHRPLLPETNFLPVSLANSPIRQPFCTRLSRNPPDGARQSQLPDISFSTC